MSSYERILVGYDGSENADRALSRAANLAKTESASLRIIVVADTVSLASSPMTPPMTEDVFDDIVKNGKDILSRGLNAISTIVPQVTGSVEQGHPADCILSMAADQRSDLIVLGRRGISGIERFLIGGVSSSIVSHSKCDVLIVK